MLKRKKEKRKQENSHPMHMQASKTVALNASDTASYSLDFGDCDPTGSVGSKPGCTL